MIKQSTNWRERREPARIKAGISLKKSIMTNKYEDVTMKLKDFAH